MKLFKKLLQKKPTYPATYEGFWQWFTDNEARFFEALEEGEEIAEQVIYPIRNQLNKLRKGYLLLVGMPEEGVAELVFTAGGVVKNFVFMDDLVEHAPALDRWKFTSLKPSMDSDKFGIDMHDLSFRKDKIQFFAIENKEQPDLIELKFSHEDATAENLAEVEEGILIYLQHILGEEHYMSIIDRTEVILKDQVGEDLVPLEKLEEYLLWRQKEFLEKYEGFRQDTEQDPHSIYEALLESGNRQVAMINSSLLNWDKKASHPWMMVIAIQYETTREDRLPDDAISEVLNSFEDRLLAELKDSDGYLNIGRESCNGIREIYFACKEVRDCSRTVDHLLRLYRNHFKSDYAIYKDKYWKTFDSYLNAPPPEQMD